MLFLLYVPAVFYLGTLDSIACFKQAFGLSKTCQGLNCFLDLLLKHLTLLRLLLDVDWLLKACPFFGADLLTCAQLFCYSLDKSDTGSSTRVFHGSRVS